MATSAAFAFTSLAISTVHPVCDPAHPHSEQRNQCRQAVLLSTTSLWKHPPRKNTPDKASLSTVAKLLPAATQRIPLPQPRLMRTSAGTTRCTRQRASESLDLACLDRDHFLQAFYCDRGEKLLAGLQVDARGDILNDVELSVMLQHIRHPASRLVSLLYHS
jgi:hypothetical protein